MQQGEDVWQEFLWWLEGMYRFITLFTAGYGFHLPCVPVFVPAAVFGGLLRIAISASLGNHPGF